MKKVATTLMISLALAAATQAAVVYSNDFDDEDLGGVSGPFVRSGKTEVYMNIVEGDSHFPTRHMELGSRTDNYNFGFCYFDGEKIDPAVTFPVMACYKFDVVLNGAGMLRMRGKDAANNSTAWFDVAVSEIVTANAVHTIELFVNNSTSSQQTVYGVVESGKYAAYSDGVSIGSGANKTSGNNAGVSYTTLWVNGDSSTSTQGVVKIDNWEISDAVPDRSLSLMGIK